MGDPGRVEGLEPYSVLGASRSDSPRALRRRYQELVRQLHPDRAAQGLGEGEREEQLRRFLEVERAWRTLGDAETRREHDLRARDRALQQEGPIQDSFSIDDMDWDDDQLEASRPCRCGGLFTVSAAEVRGARGGEGGGEGGGSPPPPPPLLLLGCDTCSLRAELSGASG
uniref:DnaJ homolog subfamily C member 24 n=1 Tax=Petromyzon marinus TaxID=7757 RepID=A0AAJ7WPM9_PETMA|nr:dnaJ homolog subfamily C member 24 [Petromyzon marinus]